MTTVNSNTLSTALSTATSGTGSTSSSVSSLGINDFITLMTTQLKYQDPTQPQDSTQFVAQLAQFSAVSGIQQMNTSLTSLADQLKSSQTLSATSLVGHSVLIDASSMSIGAGQTVTGAVQAPTGATSVNVTVTDASGQVIRHLNVAADTGLSKFTWDGKDDSGNAVAAGTYKFDAAGYVGTTSTAATTLLASKVDSVTIDSTDNSLQLNTDGLGSVTLADVKQVD